MRRIPWPHILGLFVPLTALALVLKVVTLAFIVRVTGGREFLDIARAVLSSYGAAALLSAAVLGATARWLSHRSGLLMLGVAGVVFTAVEIIGFNFYCATGTAFDARLAIFAVRHSGELAAVVGSEIGFSACALVLAWILYRNAGPRWSFWQRFDGRAGAARLGVFATSGGLLMALAWAPSFSRLETSFVRAPIITLAASLLAAGRDSQPGEPQPITTLDATLVSAPEAAARGSSPNLVVIILESARARSVTPYRLDLRTTPFLADLARHSLVAERAYTVVPHTSKSLPPILCGVDPYLDLSIVEGLPGAIPARCLPALLGERGYRSAFFQTATRNFERRTEVVRNMGFDEFFAYEDYDTSGFEEVGYFGYEDDAMFEPSVRWVRELRSEPFFLTYLTVLSHHPYMPPASFERQSFASNESLDGYLNSLSYLDRFVARVFERFQRLGLYENTVFLIVGDHGEAFGEHGRYQHDMVLWEEGLRVPLLIHAPGRFEVGQTVIKAVNHLDILPTLVELLGFRLERAVFLGESLLAPERDRPLYAYCFYELRCVAQVRGRWKYLHHFGDRPDELFDLDADRGEKDNAIAREPARAARARDEVLAWLGRTLATQRRFLERGFEP